MHVHGLDPRGNLSKRTTVRKQEPYRRRTLRLVCRSTRRITWYFFKNQKSARVYEIWTVLQVRGYNMKLWILQMSQRHSQATNSTFKQLIRPPRAELARVARCRPVRPKLFLKKDLLVCVSICSSCLAWDTDRDARIRHPFSSGLSVGSASEPNGPCRVGRAATQRKPRARAWSRIKKTI